MASVRRRGQRIPLLISCRPVQTRVYHPQNILITSFSSQRERKGGQGGQKTLTCFLVPSIFRSRWQHFAHPHRAGSCAITQLLFFTGQLEAGILKTSGTYPVRKFVLSSLAVGEKDTKPYLLLTWGQTPPRFRFL